MSSSSVLAQIQRDFLDMGESDRLQFLLEFSDELPELPARYADHPELFERVVECQSPVYIFVEVDQDAVVTSLRQLRLRHPQREDLRASSSRAFLASPCQKHYSLPMISRARWGLQDWFRR